MERRIQEHLLKYWTSTFTNQHSSRSQKETISQRTNKITDKSIFLFIGVTSYTLQKITT